MGNWTLVHSAVSHHEAELVRGHLEANDINAVILDQRSSVYPSLGPIQVLVDRDDVLRALHLINKNNDA
jgi:hypothetical protein